MMLINSTITKRLIFASLFFLCVTTSSAWAENGKIISDAITLINEERCTEGVDLLKAHSKSSAAAKYNLGVIYLKGKCVSQNYDRAYSYFIEAAREGHVSSEFNLGIMLVNGDGVNKNMEEACRWFLNPAKQGICRAQYWAGLCAEYGYYSDESFIDYYKSGALCGDSDSMVLLAGHYIKGIGVERNYNAAEVLLNEAYNMRNIDAVYNLGVLYYKGYGVPKDVSKAIAYFREASRLGSGAASHSLYVLYRDGEGVPVDNELAKKYLVRSNKQGYQRQ